MTERPISHDIYQCLQASRAVEAHLVVVVVVDRNWALAEDSALHSAALVVAVSIAPDSTIAIGQVAVVLVGQQRATITMACKK